ncbi:MAG: phosphoribosylglycinamide formyltransferase [Alphaproteobacteria bacterium]|jgi:phosphoribosylglycinamide formyltransferase-1|nr:phosphoribosylglycinamide formyltransferase [Alphaproteobacteria bacterium]
MARRRTAILISGRGTNMAALIEAARDPSYPAEIAVVISNIASAKGLEIAEAAGIKTLAISNKYYSTKTVFEEQILKALSESRIELVCLAGFMRVLSASFISHFEGRILNIHPSLLPAYRGLDTHKRALADGVKDHGCTVHFVVPELDAGPVIAQAIVPVLDGDTEETLSARVLIAENRLYPEALAKVAASLAPL